MTQPVKPVVPLARMVEGEFCRNGARADCGKDVPSARWYKLGPAYGEPEGTRINDHHLSLAEKQAVRAGAPARTH